jgi:BirA family biotin operon repressor/biotin-[acetyl-CoA-carboxylase] ligase
LEILYFNKLPSTQIYLIEKIKKLLKNSSEVMALASEESEANAPLPSLPLVVVAKEQSNGVGSRDNSWEGGDGNLFFSLALPIDMLPKDLPLSSASIYFSFIMKEVLSKYVKDIWLKWPNDLYHNNSKVGGTITKKIDTILVCGMGINLQKNGNSFEALNLEIEALLLLKEYLLRVEEYPSWKQIFSQYRIEFARSKEFFTHINREYKSLKNATLSEDGSLIIDNKRVYSIR